MARGHWRVGKSECNFCGANPCYRVKGSKEAWFLCTKCAIRNNHEIEQPTPQDGKDIDVPTLAADKAIPEWEELLGAIARGWCHPENAKKVMDEKLALAIGEEVKSFIRSLLKQQRSEVAREIINDWDTAMDYTRRDKKTLYSEMMQHHLDLAKDEYLKENEE